MITGTGVGMAPGMLRARRRDISIKPNRKLDKKSSRCMIYENEELRLRTIHFNAEVERGQSDIKKLRKENELLKKEIWNLRDEYCKLEDLLKKQQNIREQSNELENCSENENGDDYSEEYEDDEEGDESEEEASESDEVEEDKVKEESAENAENQKISTVVLESSVTTSTARAKPNFDNLSSVNEEDESTIVDDKEVNADSREQRSMPTAQSAPISSATMTQSKNFPYIKTSFDQAVPLSTASFGYQTDCPFIFPTLEEARGYSNITATDRNCLSMTCPQPYSDSTSHLLNPKTILATASKLESNVDISSHSAFPSIVSTSTPPIGWQSNVVRENPITLPNFSLLTNTTEDINFNAQNKMLLRSNLHSNFDDTKKTNSYDGNKSNQTQNLINFTSSTSSIAQNSNLARDVSNMKLIDVKPPPAIGPKQLFSPLPTKWKLPQNHDCSADSFDDVMKIEQGDAKPFFSSENVSATKDILTILQDHRTRLTKSKSCDLHKSYNPFCENVDFSTNKRSKSDSILHNIFRKLKTIKSLNQVDRSLKESKTSSPNTPDVKLPLIDYKFLNNPFLQNFEQAYQNFPLRTGGQSPIIHPLSIQISESPVPTSGYSSPVRMQPSFTGPNIADQDCNVCKRKGLEPLRLITSPTKHVDHNTEYQVTSFETPSPHTMRIPPLTPYEIDVLRRMPTRTSPLPRTSKLYQNVPFEPRGVYYPGQDMKMYCDTVAMKVPVQTQTSPEDQVLIQVDIERKTQNTSQENVKMEPNQTKKRRSRKEKSGSIKEKKRSIKRKESSKKRSSCTSESFIGKSRNSEGQDDKRESRSSSSGQESPKKDHTKRVSLYVSTKKRPSLSSRTSRSYSVENERERSLAVRDETFDGNTMNSEIGKVNSISNRESTSGEKARRGSTTSGNVPWCACWGNGCC